MRTRDERRINFVLEMARANRRLRFFFFPSSSSLAHPGKKINKRIYVREGKGRMVVGERGGAWWRHHQLPSSKRREGRRKRGRVGQLLFFLLIIEILSDLDHRWYRRRDPEICRDLWTGDRCCLYKNCLVVATSLGRVLAVSGRVGRPQGQVVTQQLHDQGRVLVAVLVQGVQLSNGVVKCLPIQKQGF